MPPGAARSAAISAMHGDDVVAGGIFDILQRRALDAVHCCASAAPAPTMAVLVSPKQNLS